MQQQRTGYVFHRTLVFFYFLLQIRRSLRLSVCAFCIRVEALYTLKHHPAEAVTSDFFIADPILGQHIHEGDDSPRTEEGITR